MTENHVFLVGKLLFECVCDILKRNFFTFFCGIEKSIFFDEMGVFD